MKNMFCNLTVAGLLLSVPVLGVAVTTAEQQMQTLNTYASIAQENYNDALNDAQALRDAIDALAAEPADGTLQAAKEAWLASRESYGTTEIFRLSGGPIDAEEGWVADAYGAPEGQINAWPLDENMIDYTVDADGNRTSGNIIDTIGDITPGGETAISVDVTELTPEVLTQLNENGGDANVATGYHAIEFLLWGQDQDYNNFIEDVVTNGAMQAGQRPVTDFTSAPGAERRLDFLQAAASKLVDDLAVVANAWNDTVDGNNGLYRSALLGELTGENADKNIPADVAFRQILSAVGVFSKSELANERIAVAVLTPSEEDEQSCFSDNTHRDIALNYQGIYNVMEGEYKGKDYGYAFADSLNDDAGGEFDKLISDIEDRIKSVNDLATSEMHFDYQVHPDNADAVQNIVTLKNRLRKLGDQMVPVAAQYGLSLTTDSVTDPDETSVN